MFQNFDEILNNRSLLIEGKVDEEQLKQLQIAFNQIHSIWIDVRGCKVDINKKIMQLRINLNPVLALLPCCLNDIKDAENAYLKIEKTLKVKMEDEVYWDFDTLYLAPCMWLVVNGEECELTKPLVEILLNNHTVTDDARYGEIRGEHYENGIAIPYTKRDENSKGDFLQSPIQEDGFYQTYCCAIELAWNKYFKKYPKNITRFFYNRRGWIVIAREDNTFKLMREEYSWDVEEVIIDFNKNGYFKFKGKTADPTDPTKEVDYQLETFGWKSYLEEFKLPLAWEFGGDPIWDWREYSPQRWAKEVFKLCLIQSWLEISEHSSYYCADHLFDR